MIKNDKKSVKNDKKSEKNDKKLTFFLYFFYITIT